MEERHMGHCTHGRDGANGNTDFTLSALRVVVILVAQMTLVEQMNAFFV